MLTQNTERRGSLVSRVTSDVDTISTFVQFGGLMLLINVAQITLATVLMVVYSPLLGLVVWVCFVPLFIIIRKFQGIVGRAYTRVRERVGDMLGAVSEAVVGAQAIRAYGVEERTAERIDVAVEAHRKAAIGAQARSVIAFTSGQLVSGMTTAVVLVVGTVLAARGSLTLGELLAFLFLVNLFTQPVQQATEILNEMQNAVAGWRRVIAIIDTEADVADPGDGGVTLPRGPITVQFNGVGFAYPGNDPVLHDIDLTIAPRSRVAIVGETGSGKSTLAKLLTRLMDPTTGTVQLDGADLHSIRFSTLALARRAGAAGGLPLRRHVARQRAVRASRRERRRRAAHPDRARASTRGWPPCRSGWPPTSVSAGSRSRRGSVSWWRWPGPTWPTPTCWCSTRRPRRSTPAPRCRLQRALDSLTRGRTSIAIAHRLSTAQAADEVIVVDAGRIVERGHHSELVQPRRRVLGPARLVGGPAEPPSDVHSSTAPHAPPPGAPPHGHPPASAPSPPTRTRRSCSNSLLQQRVQDRTRRSAGEGGEDGAVTDSRLPTVDTASSADGSPPAGRLDPAVAALLKRDRHGLVAVGGAAARHPRGSDGRMDGRRGAAPHPDRGPGDVLVAQPSTSTGARVTRAATPSGSRACASTATATPCSSRSTRWAAACHTGDHTCFDARMLPAAVGVASSRDSSHGP